LEVTVTAAMIKQIAIGFGMAVEPSSLRHAILAYAAHKLPEEQFQSQFENHTALACGALHRNIGESEISMGDVFAAMFLSWTALCRDAMVTAVTHARGCFNLLNHVATTQIDAKMLAVFGPFIVDDMSTVIAMSGSMSGSSPALPSSFVERLGYWNELCRTGTGPPQAWQSPVLETVHQYLWGALGGCFYYVKEIASQERDLIDSRTGKECLETYIRKKIYDPEFERTFAALVDELLLPEDQQGSLEAQLMGYQDMGLLAFALFLSIIGHDNLLAGFRSPQSAAIARRIQLLAMDYGRPHRDLKYYSDYYFYLAISILPSEVNDECTSFNVIHLKLTRATATRILDEISDSQLAEIVTSMQHWLRSQTYPDLIAVFECLSRLWWPTGGSKWH
jgi:Fungal specific transcription factor domain